MKNRAWLITGLVVLGVYVSMTGCGDDENEETPAPGSDSGSDGTLADTSTADTSTADTAVSTDATNDRGIENTGQSCKAPTDCYAGIDAGSLKGAVACLDRVENGYCTHECNVDADCCAVPGECKTGLKQVCSPFESTGKKYCFLSCEPADIQAALDAGVSVDAGDAGVSADLYCSSQASPEFNCRSSGGGSGNRKICLPTGGQNPNDGGTDSATDAASDASSDAADAADAPDGD